MLLPSPSMVSLPHDVGAVPLDIAALDLYVIVFGIDTVTADICTFPSLVEMGPIFTALDINTCEVLLCVSAVGERSSCRATLTERSSTFDTKHRHNPTPEHVFGRCARPNRRSASCRNTDAGRSIDRQAKTGDSGSQMPHQMSDRGRAALGDRHQKTVGGSARDQRALAERALAGRVSLEPGSARREFSDFCTF
jgi:hypothetical protein